MRIEFFKKVRRTCKKIFNQDLSWTPFEWLIKQLDYLINLEEGNPVDLSQLEKIRIGRIAVRELDGFENKELINDLCLIAKEVEVIKKERLHEEK